MYSGLLEMNYFCSSRFCDIVPQHYVVFHFKLKQVDPLDGHHLWISLPYFFFFFFGFFYFNFFFFFFFWSRDGSKLWAKEAWPTLSFLSNKFGLRYIWINITENYISFLLSFLYWGKVSPCTPLSLSFLSLFIKEGSSKEKD